MAANIHDKRVLSDLWKIKLRKLVKAGLAHVRNVKVTDLPSGFLRHAVDVLLHPARVVKRRFVLGGNNGQFESPSDDGFRNYSQPDLLPGGAGKRVVKLRQT